MIYIIAGSHWLILWLIAPPGAESSLKLNYPEIPFIDFVRGRFLELLFGVSEDAAGAATMAGVVRVGLWGGRGTNPLAALSLAVIFLLTVDPGLAVDIGFGLSALATAGLLVLAPKIYNLLEDKMPKLLAIGTAATVSAQLYTLPIILYLQPSLPVYSVLANLLVEPLVAPKTHL
ncbi:MAG: ComEC/Rec2 family competence protein, partial [Aquiluna sp.]